MSDGSSRGCDFSQGRSHIMYPADQDISDQWETTSDEDADIQKEEEIPSHVLLERHGGLPSIPVPRDCLGRDPPLPPPWLGFATGNAIDVIQGPWGDL